MQLVVSDTSLPECLLDRSLDQSHHSLPEASDKACSRRDEAPLEAVTGTEDGELVLELGGDALVPDVIQGLACTHEGRRIVRSDQFTWQRASCSKPFDCSEGRCCRTIWYYFKMDTADDRLREQGYPSLFRWLASCRLDQKRTKVI
jgi:hypothetical protein